MGDCGLVYTQWTAQRFVTTARHCQHASSHRLVHEPCQTPDAVLHGRRLALPLASRWRRRPCLRSLPTTPSVVSALPTSSSPAPSWAAPSTTLAMVFGGTVPTPRLVVKGTVVLLVVRTPPAALVAVAGRGGGVAGFDGAVMVRAPRAVRMRHALTIRLRSSGLGSPAQQTTARLHRVGR